MFLKRILETFIKQNENSIDPNISFDVLLAKKELENLEKRITSDELLAAEIAMSAINEERQGRF